MALKNPCTSDGPLSAAEKLLLSKAQRLDEYKVTTSPALQAVIDEALLPVLATYTRKRARLKVRMHVETVIVNLYAAWCRDGSLPAVSYRREQEAYIGHRLSYMTMIDHIIP